MAKDEFCQAQTYGGTLETPPEWCEDEAVVWTDSGEGYCHRHRMGAEEQDWNV